MWFSDEGISIRYLLLHPAVWFVVATGCLIFGAIYAWDQSQDQIVKHEKFAITDQRLEINPPPSWFATDLNTQLYTLFANRATLLDVDLVPVTAEYLESISWIHSVESIRKSADGLTIRLKYRTPVALVNAQDAVPVAFDSDGVVFDWSLLDTEQADHLRTGLLRISLPQLDISYIQPWQVSMDERIRQAARLCEFLNPHASELQLYRVVSYDLPSLAPDLGYHFEVWTRNGTRVVWGAAPGFETEGQPDAATKLAALANFVSSEGKLVDFPDRAAFKIDISGGSAQLIKAERSAEIPEMIELIK